MAAAQNDNALSFKETSKWTELSIVEGSEATSQYKMVGKYSTEVNPKGTVYLGIVT